ncbi:MAG TPA: aspartoacylase [Cyanobacteria bacterium UBA8553]|nr:aspartoacylase [Cyanobacteria bacterium UBA8553]HAJ62402.1 aspartoacylase [Cyanobacteria bacterium UBA8543]
MNQFNRVAIVGGTHGNEFTGAYLLKKFEQFPDLIQRSSFETLTLFANPKAFQAGRRYIDKDLNRCFLSLDLQNPALEGYEEQRAKAIAQQLGPKGSAQVDAIVDLHSTTANMGLSILLDSLHPDSLRLAAYLSSINPLVKVCCLIRPYSESPLMRSLCHLGMVIEVGPVATGVLNPTFFQETENLIHAVLDYFEACNQGASPQFSSTLTVYTYVADIDYPRTEQGELQAMIHPQLQFRDYEALHPGDPMFLTFDGQAIAYEGNCVVYPIFINEAAYYEKGIAMCLTQKEQVTV